MKNKTSKNFIDLGIISFTLLAISFLTNCSEPHSSSGDQNFEGQNQNERGRGQGGPRGPGEPGPERAGNPNNKFGKNGQPSLYLYKYAINSSNIQILPEPGESTNNGGFLLFKYPDRAIPRSTEPLPQTTVSSCLENSDHAFQFEDFSRLAEIRQGPLGDQQMIFKSQKMILCGTLDLRGKNIQTLSVIAEDLRLDHFSILFDSRSEEGGKSFQQLILQVDNLVLTGMNKVIYFSPNENSQQQKIQSIDPVIYFSIAQSLITTDLQSTTTEPPSILQFQTFFR